MPLNDGSVRAACSFYSPMSIWTDMTKSLSNIIIMLIYAFSLRVWLIMCVDGLVALHAFLTLLEFVKSFLCPDSAQTLHSLDICFRSTEVNWCLLMRWPSLLAFSLHILPIFCSSICKMDGKWRYIWARSMCLSKEFWLNFLLKLLILSVLYCMLNHKDFYSWWDPFSNTL